MPRVAEIAGHVPGRDADRPARNVAMYLEGSHREFDVPPPG